MEVYQVDEDTELLKFMLKVYSNKSRTAVKKMLNHGQFIIDGEVVTQFNHPLKAGQEVYIMSQNRSKQLSHLTSISIIHEDKDLIVIEKAAGLLSVPSDHPELDEDSAYLQLENYVKQANHNNQIFIVHRLDRDTSGVMIFAKKKEVQESLQANWQDVVKKRMYTALVEGHIFKDKGTISTWLTEDNNQMVQSSNYDNGGKKAITHFKKVQANKDYSLMEVELETGRRNQIRVHMSGLGHPVAGDKKYRSQSNPVKRLGLHAKQLDFIHPTTQELVSFSSPNPKAFYKLSR